MFFKKKKFGIVIQDEDSLLAIRAKYKNKFVAIIKCTKQKEIITIGDIQCNENNKGFGSLMMQALIIYAKQNGYKCIDGWLSDVDQNHVERLNHFYQKFGFEIIPYEDEIKIADIKLKL